MFELPFTRFDMLYECALISVYIWIKASFISVSYIMQLCFLRRLKPLDSYRFLLGCVKITTLKSHPNIVFWLSVYGFWASQSAHAHVYMYMKPLKYVKVVCEGGYETFFIWPLIPNGISCHSITPLWQEQKTNVSFCHICGNCPFQSRMLSLSLIFPAFTELEPRIQCEK